MGCLEVLGKYNDKFYMKYELRGYNPVGIEILFEITRDSEGSKNIDIYLVPEEDYMECDLVTKIKKKVYIMDSKVKLKGYHFIEHDIYVEWVGSIPNCDDKDVLDIAKEWLNEDWLREKESEYIDKWELITVG